MFGVVTVKRSSRRLPGVTPPSITLQKFAGRFSFLTRHLFSVDLASTIRSGKPIVSIREGSLKLSCGSETGRRSSPPTLQAATATTAASRMRRTMGNLTQQEKGGTPRGVPAYAGVGAGAHGTVRRL